MSPVKPFGVITKSECESYNMQVRILLSPQCNNAEINKQSKKNEKSNFYVGSTNTNCGL